MQPKVSIIIPNFNRAHIIGETLDSVKKQTYSNWECLIIDDGSTDGSEKIIGNFISEDNRFILLHRPKNIGKGAASCRNIGLHYALGKYIQFLDSDDLIAPNKLEIQIEKLIKNKKNSIATCKWGRKEPKWKNSRVYMGLPSYESINNPLDLYKIFANRFTYFPLHVFLIPLDLIKETGNWNEKLSVNDDGEFFTRLLLKCEQIIFCRETYVLYRTGAGNRITGSITQATGIKSYVESWSLIQQHIYKVTGIRDHIFVKQAKLELNQRLNEQKSKPEKEYESFFKGKRSTASYLFRKIISRVKDKIQISYSEVNL